MNENDYNDNPWMPLLNYVYTAGQFENVQLMNNANPKSVIVCGSLVIKYTDNSMKLFLRSFQNGKYDDLHIGNDAIPHYCWRYSAKDTNGETEKKSK